MERRQYSSPQISKVRLVPQEAVLTSCKSTGIPKQNPGHGQCNPVWSCYTVGS